MSGVQVSRGFRCFARRSFFGRLLSWAILHVATVPDTTLALDVHWARRGRGPVSDPARARDRSGPSFESFNGLVLGHAGLSTFEH